MFARFFIFSWIILGRFFPIVFKILAYFFHSRQNSDFARLKERFGKNTLLRPENKIFWLHASSLGEISQAVNLISELKQKFQTEVIITTATESGSNFVRKNLPGCVHQFAPFDAEPFYKSFINYWRPDFVLILENDVWPSMMNTLYASDIPIFMINVRASRSFKKFPVFYSILLKKVSFFHCRSNRVADQIRDLKVDHKKIISGGDLKAVGGFPDIDKVEVKRLTKIFSDRKILIAVSTHKYDEKLVLETFKVLNSDNSWLLIMVPRHPERAKNIKRNIKNYGLKVCQRTRPEKFSNDCQVYLADTFGELGTMLELGSIIFLGGGIGTEGGHNPFEPAKLGKAIISGPNVDNFSDAFSALVESDGCIIVKNKNQFLKAIRYLEDIKNADNMGKIAKDVLKEFSDPTKNIINFIKIHLIGQRQDYD